MFNDCSFSIICTITKPICNPKTSTEVDDQSFISTSKINNCKINTPILITEVNNIIIILNNIKYYIEQC